MNRAVQWKPLAKLLPNLEKPLRESNDSFTYIGCLTGDLLDSAVNQERTRLDIPENNEDGLFPDEITVEDIIQVAKESTRQYLKPFTEPLSEAKRDRIRTYIDTKAQQYRPLLKHKRSEIDEIVADIDDEQLDVELYKVFQRWEIELHGKRRQLLRQDGTPEKDYQQFQVKYQEFLGEWNEAGVSKLARYVVHRKATLEFLKERLKISENGKYYWENAVHQIIFPLRATNEDVPLEQMNLWILDEKLAYHSYVTSDIPLNENKIIEVESKDRPDLLIFDSPIVFADSEPPFRAITIVEFKRPMRDDYNEQPKKNPITQVYDYIDSIVSGKVRYRGGGSFALQPGVPIYAYIVCDITQSLKKQARDYQFTATPDAEGFFGYHRDYGAYVEVISYDKLVRDAHSRNQVLFEKMGLGGNTL